MKSRMKPRRIRRTFPTGLVATVSGMAAVAALLLLTANPGETKPTTERQSVLIAAENDMVLIPSPTRSVAAGEPLTSVPLTQIKWPASRLSDRIVRDSRELEASIARAPIPKLMPIPRESLTTDPGDGNAVVEKIPEGMRAITVRVDAESAVEGWARSGNFVDVILVRAQSGGDGGMDSRVIAENVRILSAGQSVDPVTGSRAPDTPATVTLLVTQEDALRIKTGATIGKLTFALRGTGDATPTIATHLQQRALLGTSIASSKERDSVYRGVARAPDGKLYVLDSDGSWLRTRKAPRKASRAFQQSGSDRRLEETSSGETQSSTVKGPE